MVRHLCPLLTLALLVLTGPLQAKQAQPDLRLKATLVVLPKSPYCRDRITHVTTLYRVNRVLEGQLERQLERQLENRTVLVVHRCPHFARGEARIGKGNAPRLRVGQVHLLTLQPLSPMTLPKDLVDPFTEDKRPRFPARQTDVGPARRHIVVVVSGGGGARHRLAFDTDRITVGRAADSDVMLSHPDVAMHQLRLEIEGDRVRVAPVGSDTLLDGKPLTAPRLITYRDRLGAGPYTLKVSLLSTRALERLR